MTNIRNEIHAITTAEIRRQIEVHRARRAQIIEERAALFGAAGKFTSPAVINEDEKASREHARALLNGHAPKSLSMPPAISRDRILLREERALDLVLKILGDESIAARATEAVAWAEEHGDEWRAVCCQIILTALRLDALECRARNLLEQCVDLHAVKLPLANVIGGRPISETSLSELAERALGAGIITSSAKGKAEHV